MTPVVRAAATSALVAFVLAAPACKKPEPPRLTPKEAQVTSLDAAGVDLRVKLAAQNPNGFELAVQKISGRVLLEGKEELGTFDAPSGIRLPAGVETVVEVPVRARWAGVGALAKLASGKRSVPYVVDAKVTIGGEKINVEVPVRLEGVITDKMVADAAIRSLPNLLPR